MKRCALILTSAILAFLTASANAAFQDEQYYQGLEDKTERFSSGVANTVKRIARGAGLKEGDPFCRVMEHNYVIVMQNTWFTQKTAEAIQRGYKNQDPEASRIITEWSKNLMHKTSMFGLVHTPDPNDFKDLWPRYFAKDLTWGLKTMRCIRHSNDFQGRLERIGQYMVKNGQPDWFSNYEKMVANFSY